MLYDDERTVSCDSHSVCAAQPIHDSSIDNDDEFMGFRSKKT